MCVADCEAACAILLLKDLEHAVKEAVLLDDCAGSDGCVIATNVAACWLETAVYRIPCGQGDENIYAAHRIGVGAPGPAMSQNQ